MSDERNHVLEAATQALVAKDAEIARLNAEASARTQAAFRSNGRLQEKIDALTAERDAAIAKIAAHNAAMDAECQASYRPVPGCDEDHAPDDIMCRYCPRRHRIEVDA